jgi:hypothetical protein
MPGVSETLPFSVIIQILRQSDKIDCVSVRRDCIAIILAAGLAALRFTRWRAEFHREELGRFFVCCAPPFSLRMTLSRSNFLVDQLLQKCCEKKVWQAHDGALAGS